MIDAKSPMRQRQYPFERKQSSGISEDGAVDPASCDMGLGATRATPRLYAATVFWFVMICWMTLLAPSKGQPRTARLYTCCSKGRQSAIRSPLAER